MKKKLALLTSALLVTSFALGATSCASKDTSKLLPETTPSTTTSTTQLSALTKDDNLGYVDNAGLMVVSSTNETTNSQTGYWTRTYTSKLFNFETGSYVSGATVTKTTTNDPTQLPQPGSVVTTYSDITKLVDGLYYSTKTAGLSTTYTLYDANGVVVSNVEGSIKYAWNEYTQQNEPDYFVKSNGDRIYVNAFGKVVTETNPLNPLFKKGSAFEVGDYWVNINENALMASVYDSNGAFQYSVNMAKEFNMDQFAKNNYVMWTVGNTAFVQYQQMLPDDAKKYDILNTSTTTTGENVTYKANLFTYSYNLEKEKSKEIDFEYLVVGEDGEAYFSDLNDKASVLYCNEIIDQRVSATAIVQTFNKNGKVAVDLQKLVPGAQSIRIVGKDTFAMSDGVKTYLCKEKEVVGEYFGNKLNFTNNTGWFKEGNCLYIYDANGNFKETITVTSVSEMMDGNLVYYTDTNICVYDTTNQTVSKTINKNANCNVIPYADGTVVLVENYGANNTPDDGHTETNDDTFSLYFLVGNGSDILNVPEKTDNLSVEANDTKYVDYSTNDVYVSGVVIKVSRGVENIATEASEVAETYYYMSARTTR